MNFIQQKNGSVDGFGIIRSIEIKSNVKGIAYLDITLGDKDGEINAKLWDYNVQLHGSYKVDDIIKFRGQVSQYNGVDQLRIDKIRLATEQDGVKIDDFIQSTEYSGEEMLSKIYSIVDTFNDEQLALITKTILDKHKQQLLYWPAAFKLHHAMKGGLLYHTLSIVTMAQYTCQVYTSIDRDLLLAGAILHDMAKIQEYDVSVTGTASGYNTRGNLLGHLVMGAMEVHEMAGRLHIDSEKAMLLEHMIISHHGEPEFGAAVRPQFIEAEVLFHLDTLDATVYEMAEAISAVPKGEFTGRMWALDNRKLYNHGRVPVEPKANLD